MTKWYINGRHTTIHSSNDRTKTDSRTTIMPRKRNKKTSKERFLHDQQLRIANQHDERRRKTKRRTTTTTTTTTKKEEKKKKKRRKRMTMRTKAKG